MYDLASGNKEFEFEREFGGKRQEITAEQYDFNSSILDRLEKREWQ